MPNWCRHKLDVLGPDADVAAFVKKAHGLDPVYKPSEDEQRLINEGRMPPYEPQVSTLSFHQIVPIPDEVAAGVYDPAGYDTEKRLWGCKWGACEAKLVEHTRGWAVYSFETAWTSPRAFFASASALFPTLLFVLSYGEEYPTRGRYAARGGHLIGDSHEKPTVENGFPQGDCDCTLEANERCPVCQGQQDWEDARLAEHLAWVASVSVDHLPGIEVSHG